ncbi:helix-turn-helix domain-containing protein [Marinimicrobium sp. ABcell2]|uniref:helix-turn-helix domain-containing protein n=1 Tax=Marinimicrobium sp. ABcell2 TaxID=3069751 RepID=UPI0027B79F6D|nr:helix-turn-helix transcriptional regulator [Marinimicrobium sp. ABcell2]MDQ2076777.1 helix-turn-helix transcriptional regulator [Marinimicrobium sp. ABcell2]
MPKPLVTDIDRHIGARLQKLRQQNGISASALAEAIGSTQQQVSRYENGENKVGAAQLYRMAQSLNTPVSWFFQGVGSDRAPLAVRESNAYYEKTHVADELAILESMWPRLTEPQRASILRLLDTFLNQ